MELIETRTVPGLARLHLAQLGDDPRRLVEFVDTLEPGVPKDRKWVIMISTQVGCAIGCAFCDAGALGYWGDLSADEMLEQVRYALRSNPELDPAKHPKLKVHFARMGEPTLNPAVLDALERLGAETGPGLIASLSTIAPRTPRVDRFLERLRQIKDALYAGGRFQLQFSLHGIDEAERARLVPARTWDFERIADFGRSFRRPDDRTLTLNLALPPSARLDGDALASRFDPEHFLFKITPVNPTGAADASGATHVWDEAPAPLAAFAERLRTRGFEVILSPSADEEIAAATSCGQLWSRELRRQAELRTRNLRRDADSYVRAPELEAKAAAWRAALAPYARPTPPLDDAALLVVDMQEFFLSPRSPAYLPAARAVARNVALLADGFRRAGRPVAFTIHAVDGERDAGPMSRWWRRSCRWGTPDARVLAALSRREDEPVFRKTRYSGFSNPELRPWLQARGVRGLVVCGVMTHLCVESTARDAFDLGFDTRVPLDACGAPDEALHLGALKSAAHGFAFTPTTEEVLESICLKSC